MKTIYTSVFVCFLFFTDAFGQCTVTKTIYNSLLPIHQCQGKHIDSLDQQYNVSGTIASATPMPPGLSGTLSGGKYTISGVPTTAGTFTFNVATSGGCSAASLSSSISIESSQPLTFSLTSAVGTNGQSLCKGKAIKNIVYSFPYSSVSVTGLPAGVTFSNSGSAITISGTPTTTVSGTFEYTLNATGSCSNGSEKGTITVYDCNKCFAHYSVKDTLFPTVTTFLLTVDSATTAFAKTYHWDFGDGVSSTTTTPNHTYTTDSIYNVCLKITTASNDSCTYCHKIGKDLSGNIYRTSGFNLEVRNPYLQQPSQVGIEKISLTTDAISISPNPSSGHFVVGVPLGSKGSIHIFNLLGEAVYHSSINNQLSDINLMSQPNGIYIIIVQTEEGAVSRKIIINN